MRISPQRIMTVCLFILQAAILLLTGGLIGIKNEQDRLKDQQQEEVVTDIAVVNLDEGVMENGKKVYYSTELMSPDGDFFASENLKTARQGILNGSYAAYILIPADFSQRAVSINTIPEKAVLEFAMNPNLREDVSRLTMSNVKNFEISLNTNMSYMYVQGLLSEFHDAQDMSGMILSNDQKEMERILAIEPDNLLVEPEYEEVKFAELKAEAIDFDEPFEKNEHIIKELNTLFDQQMEKTDEAVKQIGEATGAVGTEMNSFYQTLGLLDIEKDEEGNSVYEAGFQAMKAYLAEYPRQYEEQKEDTLRLLMAYDRKITEKMGEDEAVRLFEEIAEEWKEEEENGTQNGQKEEINLDTMKLEALKQLALKIDTIPRVDTQECITILSEQVIIPLQEEIAAENLRAAEAGKTITTALEDYGKKISEIDWYSFYNREEAGKQLMEFGDNIYLLEERILENQMAYEDYVYETVEISNTALEDWQEELENAYEDTTENIRLEVELAKEERTGMNQINSQILGELQMKLPYTRIGQLEYVQAYDFMAKPIKMTDTSVEKNRTLNWQDFVFLKNLLLALLVIYLALQLIQLMVKAARDKGLNEES
ncbi:MAG: YhgE/Pip domain-containing protein [Lachnospiraceae bacterium]